MSTIFDLSLTPCYSQTAQQVFVTGRGGAGRVGSSLGRPRTSGGLGRISFRESPPRPRLVLTQTYSLDRAPFVNTKI